MTTINKIVEKFVKEAKEASTPDVYLARYQYLIDSLYEDEIDFEGMSDEDIEKFIHKFPEMYANNVPKVSSYEDAKGNTILYKNPKKAFKEFAITKAGFKERELVNMLINKKKTTSKVPNNCGNNIGDFIDCLKKTYWNIKPEDVPEFVIGMMEQVYNTQLAGGLVEGNPIQSILYVQSPTEGTGKSYATATVCNMAREAGFEASVGNYPDKAYPSSVEFANNHFTYIDETPSSIYRNVDQEQWMAIVRRFYINIKQKYEKPYKLRSRGGIICLGNCAPVFGYGRVAHTMDNDIRNNILLRDHLLSIVSNHCVSEPINLLNSFLMKYDFYEFYAEKIRKSLKYLMGYDNSNISIAFPIVKIVRNAKDNGLWEDVIIPLFENNNIYTDNDERTGIIPEKFSSIHANKMMKDAGIDPKESRYTPIRNKLIEFLRALHSEGFINKVKDQRNGASYICYDITPLVDLDWSAITPNTDIDTPEKEVMATMEAYDKIKELLLSEPVPTTPTDPTDEKKEADFPETEDELFNQAFGWEDIDALSEVEDELPIENIPQMPEEALSYTIPESNASYKDQYCTTPTNNSTDQFEVLNPLMEGESRKDENVSTRRNFIFEIDDLPLDEQKKIAKKLSEEHIINRVVYSGSKSLHMRVTVAQAIANKEEYKFIWRQLNAKYFDGHADKACANPARLTRKLGGIRQGTGKKQAGMLIDSTPLDVREELAAYQVWARNRRQQKALIAMMDNRAPRKYATLEETVEHWRTDSEYTDNIKQAIDEVKAGVGHYDQGIAILQAAKFVGFTYEELIKEFNNFGKWNFTEQFYDSIEID